MSGQKEDRKPGGLISFLRTLGPGLIAGAADDDPTGIATYAQAGARTGYGLLWTTLLTLPMMAGVQFIAAKVAIVHRAGLAGTIRQRYPAPLAYAAVLGLIVANIINAGVDIGAIAAAINIFLPIPIALLVVPVALLIFLFLVFGSYQLIQTTFKWLTLALLAYIISSFLSKPDLLAVLKGTFIPSITFSASSISLLVAALGGNVSPYLFFWQADMEVTDEQELSAAGASPSEQSMLRGAALDTNVGMVFSNIIIFFIEVATAATLFTAGKHNVTSAAQAAQALRPVLGSAGPITWAIGMVGAGILSVPALTGSIGDGVASLFGWTHGLNADPRRAWAFYLVIGLAMATAMSVNFLAINPMRALVVSAAINGILTPPLLVLLLLIANRRDVMGDLTIGWGLNILGWGTVAVMSLAAIGLLVTIV